MGKNLVIVESPAKAKTIEKFLGKDFTVRSCFGHIRDLSSNNLSVDVENNFEPHYEIPEDKQKVVAELKKLSKNAETVWLATDEDREGEAISWHLAQVLELNEDRTKRIVFHEITKPAILKAIETPRSINNDLVDAQQARRVLDRLVGFELSPVLWKKIKPSLSAGRVQSVAVRLTVEREGKIEDFKPETSYRVVARFNIQDKDKGQVKLEAELPKRYKTEEEVNAFLGKCVSADFTIGNIETKPAKKSPAPPFTTSTLQQEASRKMGFSVSQTMTLAQRLYEAGHITYMRTDSVNLSDLAVATAKKEIESEYGEAFSNPRKYTTKTSGAQEAHEAIRPTYFENREVSSDRNQQRLYELIWKRALASQMSDAQLERTTASIDISTAEERFVAHGEVLKFEGFLKVYLESYDDEEEESKGMLPPLSVGQQLQMQEITGEQKFSRPPARYTEASLVKKLEELGIGRPSTYAPTISTIQKRGYVTKETRDGAQRKYKRLQLNAKGDISSEELTENVGFEKNKLFPSDIGRIVTGFLVEHFDKIMDYNFTATVEKEFDEIAHGQKEWDKMIASFYHPFHGVVDHTEKNAEREKGERLLGVDPKSGRNLYVRIGKYGPIAQIGEAQDEEKPVFASLAPGQTITSIDLETALNLFKLPREVGSFEDEEIKASIGRFGPYVLHKKKFYSLSKEDDPYSVSEQRAIEVIEAKRKADEERVIQTYEEDPEVQVLNGKWGPYITTGRKKNFKIPKDKDPKTLTYEDCISIAEEAAKAPAKSSRGKKSAKTTKSKKG